MSLLSSFSFGMNSLPLLAVISATPIFLYLLYLWLLPRPIPGIPYNKEAPKTLLGDLPPLLKHMKDTQQIFDWHIARCIELQSPIIQIFAVPFGKPWVVITDYREAQDILLRRSKEFDRSAFFGQLFSGILPEHHISMPTNDKFKQHRRWLQDLMTPDFLHNTAAPRIYASFVDVIQLWSAKAKLAKGHPFKADDDIYRGALDAVWAAVFGADPEASATLAQVRLCESTKTINLSSDIDDEAALPVAPNPPSVESVIALGNSVETSVKSPFPLLAHWLLRQTPHMRKAIAIKNKFLREEVEKTRKRFVGEVVKDVRCAMDDIIRREMLLSEKEGREPMVHSQGMYDEIFGFVIAAHETTSTTINWALKLLAKHQTVQSKLRSELRSGYASASSSGRNPTVQEIIKTPIPYLDAVLEENIRCSGTTPAVLRTSVVDADILGHHFPKGTEFFLPASGPSLTYPAFKIDDSLRSPTALAAKSAVGEWDPVDIGVYKPERWLIEKKEGRIEFNSTAGPNLMFGLGPRGCYGRRLAYIEMRLVLVLILWNFQLEKCPDKLSGWEASDKITHQPQQCYVRLKKL